MDTIELANKRIWSLKPMLYSEYLLSFVEQIFVESLYFEQHYNKGVKQLKMIFFLLDKKV